MDLMDRALSVLDSGGLIVVADDEDRENEGDLIGLADRTSQWMINFMITHGRGLVCFPVSTDIAARLDLTQTVGDQGDPFRTAFTQSIDAHPKHGVTTGISALDRARTILRGVDEDANSSDFVWPGHVFPLIARDGGILTRRGHTEASVDLAKMCGHKPAAVIVEILRPDGLMARRDDLRSLAADFDLAYLTVSDIVEFRGQFDRRSVLKPVPEHQGALI